MSFVFFNRLLAKHEIQELRSHTQKNFLSNNIMNKNVKNILGHTSTYGKLNKRRKNDLNSYMKGYKRRYSKKSGLGKIDCYCENKVFDKIDDIDKLLEKIQKDKNLLKKKLLHKFGIHCILFSLIPLIWLIIPLVHHGYFENTFTCYADCDKGSHKTGNQHKDNYHQAPINGSTWTAIYIVNLVLYCVTAIIVLSIIIYIFIKYIKYQRLKACRSKMSIKEYCKFCKSIFI
ncbi:hypothetical protein PVNG_06134 [Plasmodium vivax North Korean]|uniref:Variable surface protein n=1 Tax=Plasmodium vivax North Korean TaxID=1035514 RepID=A0A0J9WEL8_PLAVI|nr:hypothetical protein PVNG_06134 [Plasmodium vivax North Korean]